MAYDAKVLEVELGVARLQGIESPGDPRQAALQAPQPLVPLQRSSDAALSPPLPDRDHVRVQPDTRHAGSVRRGHYPVGEADHDTVLERTGDLAPGVYGSLHLRCMHDVAVVEPPHFALDVFGNGSTALRGGFGITKQAMLSNQQYLGTPAQSPPVQYSPQIFYGSMDTLLQASGYLSPSSVATAERDPKTPSTYNYSFGIQQKIGAATVMASMWALDFDFARSWVPRFLHRWRDLREPKALAMRESMREELHDTPWPISEWAVPALLGDWL